MLAVSCLLSLAILAAVKAVPTWAPRWNTVKECVTDIQIKSCQDFDCGVDGYHRIDSFLSVSENTTAWNYVFYKLERNQDSERCITDIKVVPEGEDCPSAPYWKSAGVSTLHGVTPGGGPTVYAQYEPGAQYAGQVVDLVVVRPGKWANKTEDFIREPINLGLGEAAGEAEFPDYREYNSVTSGWVWLEYTKGGERPAITDVQVVACPGDSDASQCGSDLVAQGWNRRDVDLNGPTVNGSHIFIFSTTEGDGCVTGLELVDSDGVNVNAGTDGPAGYLKVTQGSGDCLTSIVPVATTLDYSSPTYQSVKSNGASANFNAGTNGVPIYVYTSTAKDLSQTPPKLSFNSSGGFRIALFSDLHHTNIAPVCLDIPIEFQANCTEQFSYTFMERALDLAQPDLVVINGDLYAQNKRQADNVTYPQLTNGALLKALWPIIDRGLPFATTWGNHDAEGDLLREELQREMSQLPGYVGSRVPNVDGMSNYVADISGKHNLWFFDSRSYEYFGVNGTSTGQYGGVHQSQVAWFNQAKDATKGMAFFHIPLAEISGALGGNTTAELGVHGEDVCSQGHECGDKPDVEINNTGFYNALVDSSVKATFSGHDHSNDYAITVGGIVMTYDGSAGYTAYSEGDPNYNREMRIIDIAQWGETATSFKVIDDIFEGTVHQNMTEQVVTLF